MTREIIIGTRDSALALWQTNWVKDKLQRLYPDYKISVKSVKTQGDKILDVALAKIGDKGLFTKELEVAMLAGEIDMAVHSMKDLPTALPEGLAIGAICERFDPRDVVVSHKGYQLADLPEGARVATSSLRRRAQLLKYRPDLTIEDVRGNLNTRMRKLEEQDFDALILAAAGVERMGWAERIEEKIAYDIILPAVGQGSIGIELRRNDVELKQIVVAINHRQSQLAILAERAMLRKLEGGCQIPIGALALVEGDTVTLEGLVASLDGTELLRDQVAGDADQAEQLGIQLADKLLARGAKKILEAVRRETEEA
ncbi:hydroxymethylbilane synthase [Metallumcola ferriviriculae]|uniref:Porphobilinogen deaminase n=1 Tax=Metallumcola ferriviriculae TaxID=3039180 RepID=A0AAU0UNN2_9FIRM|nr:hydroxymethylbilane synthase [Desulfitibacteraceae bacterium MK1]